MLGRQVLAVGRLVDLPGALQLLHPGRRLRNRLGQLGPAGAEPHVQDLEVEVVVLVLLQGDGLPLLLEPRHAATHRAEWLDDPLLEALAECGRLGGQVGPEGADRRGKGLQALGVWLALEGDGIRVRWAAGLQEGLLQALGESLPRRPELSGELADPPEVVDKLVDADQLGPLVEADLVGKVEVWFDRIHF